MSGTEEKARIPLPVNVDIQLTPASIVEMLQQSKTFRETLKPRMDVGSYVEFAVSKDFFPIFYERLAKGELDFDRFIELLKAYHAEKLMTGR